MKWSVDSKYWASVIVLVALCFASCKYIHEWFAIVLLIAMGIAGAFFMYYNTKMSEKYEGGR